MTNFPLTNRTRNTLGFLGAHSTVETNDMLYILLISGIYASVCWCLLACLVRSASKPQPIRRIEAILV